MQSPLSCQGETTQRRNISGKRFVTVDGSRLVGTKVCQRPVPLSKGAEGAVSKALGKVGYRSIWMVRELEGMAKCKSVTLHP
jgi:hypothetical protein